jgi:hypothetical protein
MHMTEHKGFLGIAKGNVQAFVDQRGRTKQFATLLCPSETCRGRGSLILALRGLEPVHMTNIEALDFVEQLRQGPNSTRLKPSPFQSGRMFAVTQLAAGRYALGFDFDGNCDLLIAGGDAQAVPQGMGALLSPAQREHLADVIFKEMMVTTGALNGAVAQA